MKTLFMRAILFGCILAIAACGSDECNRQISYPDITGSQVYKQDSIALRNYLVENDLPVNITPSGIYHVTLTEGQGASPDLCDVIDVDYNGFYLSGTSFDMGENLVLPLTGVIKGWQEGIQLFSGKEKGLLLIPSYLAYGVSGNQSIPGNTPLIFEVTLNSIN